MSKILRRLLAGGLFIAVVAVLAFLVVRKVWWSPASQQQQRGARGPVPVEVAPIRRGHIEDRRTFSGTLTPQAQFIVAPKVTGRVESLLVDVGQSVSTGDVVATLDDDEFIQSVAQAQAELEVARANLAQAGSALEIARREHERVQTLRERGVASDAAFDAAVAELRAKEAQVEVAQAEVKRAEASLASQRVRLGYTQVTAVWPGGGAQRVVSQRFVDEGATVAANNPIVTVVDNSTVRAVLFVAERDYARLSVGQPVALQTDAYPADTFAGKVLRLSPVFEERSRQARVEVEVPNADGRLKPGMFVRAGVVLSVADDATLVPTEAITRRNNEPGVFVVDAAGQRVAWAPVRLGIEAGGVVQVSGEALVGRVVTLGQQMLDDGAAIRIPERRSDQPGRQTQPQPQPQPEPQREAVGR